LKDPQQDFVLVLLFFSFFFFSPFSFFDLVLQTHTEPAGGSEGVFLQVLVHELPLGEAHPPLEKEREGKKSNTITVGKIFLKQTLLAGPLSG